jgi:RNA polymerase sigma factor (sigma-70 family)
MLVAVNSKKQTVHPVDKILAGLKPAIAYFAWQATSKCHMDYQDAVQELNISAWMSILKYNEYQPQIKIDSWVKSNLHFKSLDMVNEFYKKARRGERAMNLVKTEYPGFTEDHADAIVNKIAIQQKMKRLPYRTQQVINLRTSGYLVKEIGVMLDLDRREVSRILHKVA